MAYGSYPLLPRPPPSWHQCSPDITPASSSAQDCHGFAAPPQRTTSICTLRPSSARMHHFQPPRTPSPPPSSSSSPSSDDALAPIPSNLTKRLHPRHTRRSSRPLRQRLRKTSPYSSELKEANEMPSSTSAAPSELCLHQRLPSAPCPNGNQQKDVPHLSPLIPFKRRRTMDLHCEEEPAVSMDDIDVAEEDDRKLVMWRAACAMAHAYLHPEDHQQPDLHQGSNRLEASSLTCGSHHGKRDETLESKRLQVNGHDCGWQTEDVDTPCPSSGSSTSSKVGVSSTPSCMYPPGDVVDIDDVVNPTQAAEWFGAHFSATSTLVS